MKPNTSHTIESPASIAWRQLRRNKAAVVGAVILILMVLACVVGPWIIRGVWGYTDSQMVSAQYLAPTMDHWFGTDIHGRDLLTRVLLGGRVSLMAGLMGAVVSLTVGVLYGMISGYLGGRVDNVMMRIVDILYSLPRIVFVIIFITAFEKLTRDRLAAAGLASSASTVRLILLFISLGIIEWLTMARIVRGQVLVLKERQFVLASQSLGAGDGRIIFKHLLPNLWGIIIVYLTLTVPVVILMESFLSFLGLGIQAPQSSWGTLIADGSKGINPITMNWWLLVFPGLMMGLTLLALNFLGDGLRDVLDPRTRKD